MRVLPARHPARIAFLVSALAAAPLAAAETISSEERALIQQAEAARIAAVERVYGSVVCIYGNNRQGGGSGVLFDPSGLALTNHHVIGGAGIEGWGGLADGKLYRWKLVGTDPGGDVAIIQLQGLDQFPAAPLGDSDLVRTGDFVMAMGNPFVLAEDQRPTVTLGIVSGIERFQKGSGNNLLVYGNCIQVDTSINPGNSGGPLFNMRGEVVGINGRISLLERGRVNVGVGYAISMEQIKHFIPDLLATKIAQHGTLDAQFSNRAEGVICDALNLDSPTARAGLELGDRLVEFEDKPIHDANVLTNLISTLPTDWPVHLVLDREGRRRDVWVRLTPLPYVLQKPRPDEPEPEPGERRPDNPPPGDPNEQPEEKHADKPADAEKPKPADSPEDGDKPSEAEKPKSTEEDPPAVAKKPGEQPGAKRIPTGKVKVVPKPQLPLDDPNKIRDRALNRANVKRIWDRMRALTGADRAGEQVAAFRLTDAIFRGDERVGEADAVILTDGRFRVEYTLDGRSASVRFDGRTFFRTTDDADDAKETTAVDVEEALSDVIALQTAVLAATFRPQPLESFGDVQLDGGDKAQGMRSYRLRAGAADEPVLFAWLSLFDSAGRPEVRLLKAGRDADAVTTRPAVTFEDWREAAGAEWPHKRTVVIGLSETPVLKLVSQTCERQEQLPDDLEPQTPADQTNE
jgi:S1-C subfamily serine protease